MLFALLRDGRIDLYHDDELLDELRNVRLVETIPGQVASSTTPERHDDRAWRSAWRSSRSSARERHRVAACPRASSPSPNLTRRSQRGAACANRARGRQARSISCVLRRAAPDASSAPGHGHYEPHWPPVTRLRAPATSTAPSRCSPRDRRGHLGGVPRRRSRACCSLERGNKAATAKVVCSGCLVRADCLDTPGEQREVRHLGRQERAGAAPHAPRTSPPGGPPDGQGLGPDPMARLSTSSTMARRRTRRVRRGRALLGVERVRSRSSPRHSRPRHLVVTPRADGPVVGPPDRRLAGCPSALVATWATRRSGTTPAGSVARSTAAALRRCRTAGKQPDELVAGVVAGLAPAGIECPSCAAPIMESGHGRHSPPPRRRAMVLPSGHPNRRRDRP